MTTRLAVLTRTAMVQAVATRVDGGAGPGYLEIRSGSQPATGDTAASGTLLATIPLNDPAFDSITGGVATADITPQPSGTGVAAGTAGWARAYDSTGASVIDGSVSASGGGGDFIINTTTISIGLTVNLTGWTITQPAG